MDNKEKLRRIVADPVLWIETFVNIVDKNFKVIPFKMNPQQKYYLRNMDKYNIVLKSRQIGITTVAEAYSIYLCSTRANVNCLLMADNDNNAKEIFSKLKAMYDNLNPLVKIPSRRSNVHELELVNGSKIICVVCGGKDNGRGSTLQYAHFSEVGSMGDTFNNQLIAIEQAIVPGGQIVLESTAKGLNHFSEMWNKSVSGENPMWKPFFFGWVDDKRMWATEYEEYSERYKSIHNKELEESELDEIEIGLREKGATMEQLMWRRLKILNDGEEKFCQEFPSNPIEAFVSSGSNVFKSTLIVERMQNLHNTPEKKLPADVDIIIRKHSKALKIWRLPEAKKRYYIGVDTGEGLGGAHDYSVISVIDADGFQCAEWRSNKVKPYEFAEVVYEIAKWYGHGLLVVEKASGGHTVVDKIKHTHGYVNMFKYKSYDAKGKQKRKVGWETTSTSKPMMISDMQELFEKGQCLVNSRDLLNEMKLFQSVDGKLQAASGHDDAVMAFAMALQGLKSGQYYYAIGK